jgi:hypothetical protein
LVQLGQLVPLVNLAQLVQQAIQDHKVPLGYLGKLVELALVALLVSVALREFLETPVCLDRLVHRDHQDHRALLGNKDIQDQLVRRDQRGSQEQLVHQEQLDFQVVLEQLVYLASEEILATLVSLEVLELQDNQVRRGSSVTWDFREAKDQLDHQDHLERPVSKGQLDLLDSLD